MPNKGLTQWVINFCKSEGYDWIYFIYEVIGTEHEGLVPVKLGENEYNLINADNELAYPDMTLTPTKVIRMDYSKQKDRFIPI